MVPINEAKSSKCLPDTPFTKGVNLIEKIKTSVKTKIICYWRSVQVYNIVGTLVQISVEFHTLTQ